jgi:hypothetical protein
MWRILKPRRRETIIALRATKTAHGMARDVQNPHLNVPEFKRPVMPADDVLRPIEFVCDDPKPLAGEYMRACVTVVLVLMACAALVYVVIELCDPFK